MSKIINKIALFNSKHTGFTKAASIILTALMFSVIAYIKPFFPKQWYAGMLFSGSFTTVLLVLLNIRNVKASISKTGIVFIALELIIGVSFLINGVAFRAKGYLAIGVIFTFLVPIMQYLLAKSDIKELVDSFAKGIAIMYLSLLVMSILFAPKLTNFQYVSVLYNKNSLGSFLTIVIPSSFYLFIHSKTLKFRILYWSLLVSSITLMVFSSSRTAFLAAFFMVLYLVIIEIVNKKRNKDSNKFKPINLVFYLLATVLVPVVMFLLLSTLRGFIIKQTGPYNIFYTKEEAIELRLDMEEETTDFSLDYLGKGFSNTVGEDNLTSGRMTIWKKFLSETKFTGHATESMLVQSDTRLFKAAYAHNVYIQVAYSVGIIAGVAYLIIVLMAGVKVLAYFVKYVRAKEKYDLHKITAYCFVIVFGLSSLAETNYAPFTRFNTTCFWLLSFFFIFKRTKENTAESEEENETEAIAQDQ